MRKALILVVLAAGTALSTPALAQDGDPAVIERYQQLERQNQQRYEQRQQRREERQQAREERRERPVDAGIVPQADRRERREERREERQERRGDRQVSDVTREAWQGRPDDPNRERYERLARENAFRYGTPQQRQEVRDEIRRDRRQDRREERRERRRDRYDGFGSGWGSGYGSGWDLGWRNDRRYDWYGHRSYNRNLFRAPRYYSPYGQSYRYRRFGIGSILDSLFWGRNYWISDPWQYRLPRAPAGYVWVRYYNDVVLVDRFNGRIVDVIHDFFW